MKSFNPIALAYRYVVRVHPPLEECDDSNKGKLGAEQERKSANSGTITISNGGTPL